MSRPAVAASSPLPFELVISDGEPMDNFLHVLQMQLLFELTDQVMLERGRMDYFYGGDMFVYYSVEQAREVAEGRPYFRGPDFFLVDGVPPRSLEERKAWVSWEEGGHLPDLIVELLSPSTEKIDRTVKKVIYARDFQASEYYLYKMETRELEGNRLAGGVYKPMARNTQGRFRSQVFGLELGVWRGEYRGKTLDWLRFFEPDGRLVPTPAEAEAQRADAEFQRAEAAEAELRRLRAQLGGE